MQFTIEVLYIVIELFITINNYITKPNWKAHMHLACTKPPFKKNVYFHVVKIRYIEAWPCKNSFFLIKLKKENNS
jgi:hypothetical protein